MALLFYLEQDLQAVLANLAAAGLVLDEAIQPVLRREAFRRLGQASLPGCTLELRRPLEFWPLLGDAASPEQGGGSRLVYAITARVALRLWAAPDGASEWRDWQIFTAGVALPMRHEHDAKGEVQVFGLRYRSFVPRWGLHPTLSAQAPVHLLLRHPGHEADYLVAPHEWRPDGDAYPGLPEDLAAASQRRADRVTLDAVPRNPAFGLRPAPPHGLDPYCLDLRCLSS